MTGATGFVGSHLVEALASHDVRVRALVRRTSDVAALARLGVERVEGGLEDGAALARAMEGADVVFHLAAMTRARSAAEYERVNAGGTRAVVAAATAADPRPRRLVYLSSLAAVGPSLDGRPVGADEAPRPLTAYGRTKLAGERACLAARDILDVVVLRAPAVYGPRDRELLRMFRLAAWGILPVPAGPVRRVQLIHVADLARALICAASAAAATGVYHAAEARAYGWAEVADLIGRAVGRPARQVRVPASLVHIAAAMSEWTAALRGRTTLFNREKARELLAPGWLCETDALRRDTGFEAQIPLPEGLRTTAAWYRAQHWLRDR
ncbi:MAG TPA: NAD-dependent epimerase/dehydratase family protein [Longimicrobiales bacterium]